MSHIPRFIDENRVIAVLKWPQVIEAVEEGIRAASSKPEPAPPASNCGSKNPYAIQPARIFTQAGFNSCNYLLAMPGFLGDWELEPTDRKKRCSNQQDSKLSTLICKCVTNFPINESCPCPLPHVMAHILFYNVRSGCLECIIEANTLTVWRTAAASAVATRYLYYRRFGKSENRVINLAIIGSGVEGHVHALAMLETFCLNTLYLWDEDIEKAKCLAKRLCPDAPNVDIKIGQSVQTTVSDADVICMCTDSCEPLLTADMITKPSVHINAAGMYGQIGRDVYEKAAIYTDSRAHAQEIKNLPGPIVAEVGEVIKEMEYPPIEGITIFQCMGMAAEDAPVAHIVYNAYR
ncbi:ketimine reductase mu-crystallin-like [Teleopsis dalmanni]|uniref:ketimine reductase mu-crystallin-like n=1 Tax=Teleopsis dalmanni TaxID=139649 RepID=UPI0018CD9EDF|nr:ketimine reductase mu-crystallin-like [Teleopsis dalmanni]XP_037932405.1 ketimine reductase mu-crystallin-like [Teleopsis dalmanni]